MDNPHLTAPPGRKSLTLPAAILALVAAIAFAWSHVSNRMQATESRVTDEFITPCLSAFDAGDADRIWRTLTTESFRRRVPREAFLATFAHVHARFGRPVEVTVHSVQAMRDTERAWQRVVTRWTWQDGPRGMLRVFDLVDVPGTGYRMHDVRLRDAVLPDGMPAEPW